MLSKNVLLALSLAALGSAQDIDSNDVPSQCQSVCGGIVSLTEQCDQQNDDDSGYINCICTSNNAATALPLCEACYAQYSADGNDNDVNDLVSSCSFTTTSYTPTATSVGQASNVAATTTSTVRSTAIASAGSSFGMGNSSYASPSTGVQPSASATAFTGGASLIDASVVATGMAVLGAVFGMLYA